MKTLFSTIATILGGCILLSSCSQSGSLAITKRHYNKGYYVDVSGKRETVKPKQLTIVDKDKNISAPASTIAPLAANATDPNNNTIIADNQVSNANISPVENKQSLKNVVKHVNYKVVKSAIAASASLQKSIVHSENAPQSIANTTDDGGGRVHSLFWLVITIILIVWLIGILTGSFGLGVLINLLLLFAVVLFILWLLWLI
jgi:hypothetical protein